MQSELLAKFGQLPIQSHPRKLTSIFRNREHDGSNFVFLKGLTWYGKRAGTLRILIAVSVYTHFVGAVVVYTNGLAKVEICHYLGIIMCC